MLVEPTEGINFVTGQIVDASIKVHAFLGPGLLESAYEKCLAHELRMRGLNVETQVPIPVSYGSVRIDVGYRLDMLVDSKVAVEIKATNKVSPIWHAQLLSYVKLSNLRVGLLINFHVGHLVDGLRRVVL